MQLKTLAQLLSGGTFRREPDPGKEREGRGAAGGARQGQIRMFANKKNFFLELTTGRCSGGG